MIYAIYSPIPLFTLKVCVAEELVTQAFDVLGLVCCGQDAIDRVYFLDQRLHAFPSTDDDSRVF